MECRAGPSSSFYSQPLSAWDSAPLSTSFIQCRPVLILINIEAFKYFRRLDYAGVILNIVGTGVAPIYYSLYCNPLIGSIYLTIMIAFGAILFVVLMQNWIHKNKNQHYKPILFGIFGLTYIIPYSHFMIS